MEKLSYDLNFIFFLLPIALCYIIHFFMVFNYLLENHVHFGLFILLFYLMTIVTGEDPS